MRKDNISLSFGIDGMTRSSYIHQLDEKKYTYQMNGNLEDLEGDGVGLTNEQSNLLCSRFKPGYKVIGNKIDLLYNRVYFFLTNPDTGISEIGYINFNRNIEDEDDLLEQCGCKSRLDLSESLENIEQIEYCNYVTILSDECNKCLGFNINNPIYDIEIKHEVLGSMIIFTDGNKEPRYINLDKLESYKEKNVLTDDCDCSEEPECKEATCLDCEKLRIFPLFRVPNLNVEKIQLGGRLKMGTYEYAIAYCDKLGNERTSYYSFTNKVKIHERDLAIFGNERGEEITNYGIRLKVKNLDKNFSFYKIAVIQTTSDNATTTYNIEGIHPITDTEILHTSNDYDEIVTLNQIYAVKPTFKKWRGLTTANDYLFGYGYTKEKEWNLQKLGVFIGALTKWQTYIAGENLYNDPVNNEKYTGYMRDEVYASAIRFTTDYGYTTPLINLVGRPAEKYDLEDVSDTVEAKSIYDGVKECTSLDRDKRWQFFNTAKEEGICDVTDNTGELTTSIFEEMCASEKVYSENGNFTLHLDGAFVDIQNYIDEYRDEICVQNSPYYSEFLCNLINYDDGEYCEPQLPYPICNECETNTCFEPTKVEFEDGLLFKNEISNIENVRYDLEKRESLSEYIRTPKPISCSISESTDYNTSFDKDAIYMLLIAGGVNEEKVIDIINYPSKEVDDCSNGDFIIPNTKIIRKNYSMYNDCASAVSLESPQDMYFTHEMHFEKSEVKSNIISQAIGSFESEVAKRSKWYSFEFGTRDSAILEITEGLRDMTYKDATVGDNIVRVSIYDKCSSSRNLIDVQLVDLKVGFIKEYFASDFGRSKTMYVVVDTPIKEIRNIREWETDAHRCKKVYNQTPIYTNESTNYCSTILVRDVEYESVTVSFDKIEIEKLVKYESECTYYSPSVNDCEAKPYRYGKFSYWESTEKYPNNKQLYDSSDILINIDDIPAKNRTEFEKYFVKSITDKGRYILNDNANVACKPIRHFKFPDNRVAPFMDNSSYKEAFSESNVYPIGFKVDIELINSFLEIAVKNKLITREQRDSITNVEFFRGDRRIHKSILYKGIANDMYQDTSKKDTYFRNFPYNSLGKNIFLATSKERDYFIDHPFDSKSNNRFSVIAPELYYKIQTQTPTEVSIEGYMYGNSIGKFQEVEGHSKWVILGNKLRRLARTLATLETTAEIAMGSQQLVEAFSGTRVGLSTNPTSPAAIAAGVVTQIAVAANSLSINGKYVISWMESFKSLGNPVNFASMYVSPKGWYNNFKPNLEDKNYIRGVHKGVILKDGLNVLNEKNKTIKLNNIDRETSLYLNFGNYNLEYPEKYINYDNSSLNVGKSSRYNLNRSVGLEDESVRNIASPYFSMKNFVPDQYGSIDGIKWLSTGNSFDLKNTDYCSAVFGGDISISRVDLKNKFPFFTVNAMKLADRTPIKYDLYSNVGHSYYYCNYDTEEDNEGFSDIPVMKSSYVFDNHFSDNSRYLNKPASFYLFSYGMPYFLVESEINANFRYKGKETHELYPSITDVYDWVQEEKTSIEYNNIFYYNNIFSNPQTSSPYKILPGTYDKDEWDKLSEISNGVVYSQQDNSEISLDSPWLVFRPFDEGLLKTEYGRLIKMKGIESNQVLGIFENNSVIFNAVDQLRDRVDKSNEYLGTGGIFQTRPMEFSNNELGDTGSQSRSMVSTEFGHFTVDAKRGKVYQIKPNGNGLSIISDMKQSGEDSGMRKWFKKHLPFKILKEPIKGLNSLNIDNSYKGLGILTWYDSVFKRVFITKKDYKANKKCLEYIDGDFYYNLTECEGKPQIISCPDGYEYDSELNMCVIKQNCTQYENLQPTCPMGGVYNEETGMCEGGNPTFCTSPLDIAFILDSTGSQQPYINAVENGIISKIVPALVDKSDNDYRLGLVSVTDDKSKLFNILTQFDNNNELDFKNALGLIVATGGGNTPEPMDMALNAVLTNTPAINESSEYVDNFKIGEFREDSEKVVFYITDASNSGTDDFHDQSDVDYLDYLINLSILKGVKVFVLYCSKIPYEYDANLLRNLAERTGGQFYHITDGSQIDESIVDAIQNQIVCGNQDYPPVYGCPEGYDYNNTLDLCYAINNCDEMVQPTLKDDIIKVELTDEEYFKDVSWTIAYSPLYQNWVSYYDFKPNYAVAYPDYFQTGVNYSKDDSELGVWSHLLTNKSYQVFYGKLYPWVIDIPIKNTYSNNILENVKLWTASKRYVNDYDTSFFRKKTFNKAVIYNNTNNSGELNLAYEDTHKRTEYPKKVQGKNYAQVIPVTHFDNVINMNYFYNRVINVDNHINIWSYDDNEIEKDINPKAVSMTSKRVLERMRGEMFNVRLTQDKSSQFRHYFKWLQAMEDSYT